MFKILSIIVFAAILLGFPLAKDSRSAQLAKAASTEFKVNGASFTECVEMADALTVKGDGLSASEDFEKAIEYYNMAISINGNHAKALLNRGVAYYNLGRSDLALTDINRSIEIEVQGARAFNSQGVIYSEAKKYDLALKSFSRAIALDPDHAQALNSRGVAFVKKGFYDKAINDFNNAMTKDPTLVESLSNRGDAYEQLGNYRKACRDWKRACDKDLCDKFKFMELIGACKNG